MWRNNEEGEFDDEPDVYFSTGKRKKISKEEQIYGVFGSTEVEPEPEIEGIGTSLNFVRSSGNSALNASSKLRIVESDPLVTGLGSDPEEEPVISPKKFQFTKPTLPKDFGVRISGEAKAEAQKAKELKKKEQVYETQYGKGFKMLKNLGYTTGGSIGKSGTGILDPIIPQKRPDKLGLNYGGFKEQSAKEKIEEIKVEKLEPVKRWKLEDKVKKETRREEKQKFEKDFIAYKREVYTMPKTKTNTMKIIDMTKPQTVVMEDMSKVVGRGAKPLLQMKTYAQFYLDQCRNANKMLYSEVEEAKNNLTTYKYEDQTLRNDIEITRKELEEYRVFMNLYKEESVKWNKVSLSELFSSFKELFNTNSEFYKTCNLPELSANLILTRAKRELIKWPIKDAKDTKYLRLMQSIQNFFKETIPQPYGEEEKLTKYNITSSEDTLQKYMLYFLLILEEAWIPIIVSYINNEWDPKEPEELIDLCEAWKIIVPQEVMLMLYETNVTPRIQQAVEDWDPFTDTISIHIWVHPWLPVLGLNTLGSAIEAFVKKVMGALKNWLPEDDSAMLILKPWKQIVGEKNWNGIMRRCIIPKLAYSIKELEVNPVKQIIQPLEHLFSWLELIENIDSIQIMKDFFFPKWVEVLGKWIQKGADKKELYAWYTGWKEFIPKVIAEDPSIKRYFAEALRLIQEFLK